VINFQDFTNATELMVILRALDRRFHNVVFSINADLRTRTVTATVGFEQEARESAVPLGDLLAEGGFERYIVDAFVQSWESESWKSACVTYEFSPTVAEILLSHFATGELAARHVGPESFRLQFNYLADRVPEERDATPDRGVDPDHQQQLH
jgi:hypothetical protein